MDLLDTAFLSFYILNLILFALASKRVIEKNTRTLYTAYLVGFFLTNYIGIFQLYFMLDDYRVSIEITDKHVVFQIFIYSTISSWLVLLSSTLLDNVKIDKKQPPPKLPSKSIDSTILAILIAVSVAALAFFLHKSDSIALSSALQGDTKAASIQRSTMGNANTSSHWFRLAFNQIAAIAAYILYIRMKENKDIIHKILFAAWILTLCYMLLLTTAKFSIFQFFIGLLFLRTTKFNKLKPRHYIAIGTAATLTIGAMYWLFAGVVTPERIFQAAFSRITTGSIAPSYFYLQYIATGNDYYLGTTFPNPGGIMPFKPVSVSVEMMHWWFNNPDSAIVGSSPTAFWAEAYVNFGTTGVVASSIYAGMLIGFLNRLVRTNLYSPTTWAISAWLFSYIFTLNISGISEFIKPTFILPIIFLVALSKIRLIHAKNTPPHPYRHFN